MFWFAQPKVVLDVQMAQGPCNAPSSPHKRWSLRTWVVSEAISGLGACQVRATRTTRCGEHATNRARRGIRVAGWPGSLPGRAARRKGAGHCALGWLVMLLAGLGAACWTHMQGGFFAPPSNLELASNSTRVGFPPHLGGGGHLAASHWACTAPRVYREANSRAGCSSFFVPEQRCCLKSALQAACKRLWLPWAPTSAC